MINLVNLLCPGQTNIVPGQVAFDVEVRSYQETELQEIVVNIQKHVESVCAARETELEKRELRA